MSREERTASKITSGSNSRICVCLISGYLKMLHSTIHHGCELRGVSPNLNCSAYICPGYTCSSWQFNNINTNHYIQSRYIYGAPPTEAYQKLNLEDNSLATDSALSSRRTSIGSYIVSHAAAIPSCTLFGRLAWKFSDHIRTDVRYADTRGQTQWKTRGRPMSRAISSFEVA